MKTEPTAIKEASEHSTVETQSELLPCPFCGGEACISYVDRQGGSYWSVGCCATADEYRKQDAIDRWNTRAPSVPSATAALPAPVSPKSGCSPGASRAAAKIIDSYDMPTIEGDSRDIERMGCLIDSETGLPGLLEALKNLLKHSGIADSHDEDKEPEDHQAESAARSAIAKAEGNS